MIEDLLSEFVVDFSIDKEKPKSKKEEDLEEKEDFSKITRLQIININGEIVDA